MFDERDDELSNVLNAARRAIQTHPIAAQAIFAALAAEGRRLRKRPKDGLEGSSGRLGIARAGAPGLGHGQPHRDHRRRERAAAVRVSRGVLRAAAVDALEPLLSRLFDEGV